MPLNVGLYIQKSYASIAVVFVAFLKLEDGLHFFWSLAMAFFPLLF